MAWLMSSIQHNMLENVLIGGIPQGTIQSFMSGLDIGRLNMAKYPYKMAGQWSVSRSLKGKFQDYRSISNQAQICRIMGQYPGVYKGFCVSKLNI
ncbi:MAG: hypothetical protein EZS28_030048 [Streblomastix strix]|uniref:Uncharacterized protein n=1 Tax=Streblomastix strix TaxID=222440 RepID=A0A5J4UUW2_9EUKA|nr:MAG: hypothetical protein EZS28_030048 [Streblomastix strix]